MLSRICFLPLIQISNSKSPGINLLWNVELLQFFFFFFTFIRWYSQDSGASRDIRLISLGRPHPAPFVLAAYGLCLWLNPFRKNEKCPPWDNSSTLKGRKLSGTCLKTFENLELESSVSKSCVLSTRVFNMCIVYDLLKYHSLGRGFCLTIQSKIIFL